MAQRMNLLALCVMAVGMIDPAAATDIVGRASVVDGDTIEIQGQRIRLWGIDAPEADQLCRDDGSEFYNCGRTAATALAGLFYVIPRQVICSPTGQDQSGLTIAVCYLGSPGPDVGRWLIANGFALDWSQSSQGKYGAVQQGAKNAGRGIWAGSFVEPWTYRVCRASGMAIERCSDGD